MCKTKKPFVGKERRGRRRGAQNREREAESMDFYRKLSLFSSFPFFHFLQYYRPRTIKRIFLERRHTQELKENKPYICPLKLKTSFCVVLLDLNGEAQEGQRRRIWRGWIGCCGHRQRQKQPNCSEMGC